MQQTNVGYLLADFFRTPVVEEHDQFLATTPKSHSIDLLDGLTLQVKMQGFYGSISSRERGYLCCDLYVSGNPVDMMVCAFFDGTRRDVFLCRSDVMPNSVPHDFDLWQSQYRTCMEKCFRHFEWRGERWVRIPKKTN